VIKGGAGSDTVAGGLGNDRLYGEAGRDTFLFDTRAHKTRNMDKIYTFSTRDDTIQLENAVFTKVGKGTPAKPTKLAKDAFWTGSKAADKEDRIVYDKKTGALYYDADGSGKAAQVKFATLDKNLKMTNADFLVI